MKRALLSVSDKTGLVDFATALIDRDFELVATGGTQRMLEEAGLPVTGVETVTGFPEMLDGRVKTLHPLIHAGILARREDPEHMAALAAHAIVPIDLVCVNLYPFAETIKKPNVTVDEAIEQIDIGGPSALRAASKNRKSVWAVADPHDYQRVLEGLDQEDAALRDELGAKVFAITAAYDATIARYLDPEPFPQTLTLAFHQRQTLRYGENAQQAAAFYATDQGDGTGIVGAMQQHGKELSYNNIKDADAALSLLQEFDGPAVVAVKHMNPCGVGLADEIDAAWDKAYAADPMSIFGGIIALNRPVTVAVAEKMHELFLEIIMAPSFEPEAFEILAQKKNVRLLTIKLPDTSQKALELVSVHDGLLVQDQDDLKESIDQMKVVTKTVPTRDQLEALAFAQVVVKHVKSNAIVVAQADQTLGIGAGQMNRIGSVKLAVDQAQQNERFAGAVMASDAFFPMDDCVAHAAQHNIKAIIQPGGSLKDQASIDKADEYGIAMVTTGVRHFRH